MCQIVMIIMVDKLQYGVVIISIINHYHDFTLFTIITVVSFVFKVLGRPLYSLSCISTTSSDALRSVLLAAVQMGCILSLSGSERLVNAGVKTHFASLLSDIKEALNSSGLLTTNEFVKPNNVSYIVTMYIYILHVHVNNMNPYINR